MSALTASITEAKRPIPLSFMTVKATLPLERKREVTPSGKYLMTDNSGTHQVYCVESGVDFQHGQFLCVQKRKEQLVFSKPAD